MPLYNETSLTGKRIEQAIQKGLDSPRMGWVMSEILEMFSGDEKRIARDYILDRCNIKEEKTHDKI